MPREYLILLTKLSREISRNNRRHLHISFILTTYVICVEKMWIFFLTFNLPFFSKVPAFLNVVDIAGLVKGASEGQGLGNAFLSHINACDGIFHLCRKWKKN